MNDDDRELMEIHEDDEVVLTVRDRRRNRHFRIDNLIMEHWFPLIRETGYSLYSLLVYQSNEAAGESVSVSYSFLSEYLDLSRSTLSYYITFLEYCGLIFRDRPELVINDHNGHPVKKKRFGNKSNTYYILDIKPVDANNLKTIQSLVDESDIFSENYRCLFAERIQSWMSIHKHWGLRRARRIKTVIGQPPLPLNGSTPPPAQDKQPNKKLTTTNILSRMNVVDQKILNEFAKITPHKVLGFVWFTTTEKGLDPNRITGFIITNLRKQTPPPVGFLSLAKSWLDMDENGREDLLSCAFSGQLQHVCEQDLEDQYNFTENTIFTLYLLGQETLYEWIS